MIEIKLNEAHYNEILAALEFYMRFHTGQLSSVLCCDYVTSKKAEDEINKILGIKPWDYRTKGLTYEISRQMIYEQNKYYNIKNVYSSEPLKCTENPLIQINYDK